MSSNETGIRPVKWVEISDCCDRKRMMALSEEMTAAGLENSVTFIECGPDGFGKALDEAERTVDQIRVGGGLREIAAQFTNRLPSLILTLRSVDAFVQENGQWWPRNFLLDGLGSSISEDLTKLDLTGAVFVIGANADARAAIAAFVRVGYSRFNVADMDDGRARELVEELRRSYFKIQFQAVARHIVTQLPSIHSVAINTIGQEDDGILGELFYLNFLRQGGVWLDLPLVSANDSLVGEARSVGAFVEPSALVLDRVDRAWVKSCFGVALGADSYRERLFAISSQTM